MPSKILSSTSFSPKAPMAPPFASFSLAGAIGASSVSAAASADARVQVSAQQDASTTMMYFRSGFGSSAAATCSSTRWRSSCPRSGFGCGGVSTSGMTELAGSDAPASSGKAKMMLSTPVSASTFARSCSLVSPSLVSSSRAPLMAISLVLLPDTFRVLTTLSKKGRIAALALGPLCTFSFQSSVDMRRTSWSSAVRAMKIEDSSEWR
mmetsp:Transcript_39546/g.117306  ORF Transcript_39546/g.117306 Transcript_39546/m.117306 type:complete len:208 (+) Transcript_39546:1629-2252(+)